MADDPSAIPYQLSEKGQGRFLASIGLIGKSDEDDDQDEQSTCTEKDHACDGMCS